MRLVIFAGQAALALALAACGTERERANQLSTNATVNDAETSAALGAPVADGNGSANAQ